MSLPSMIDEAASRDADEESVARTTFSLSAATGAEPGTPALSAFAVGAFLAMTLLVAQAGELRDADVLTATEAVAIEQLASEQMVVYAQIVHRSEQARTS